MSVAPGTKSRSPTAVSMLDAVRSFSGYFFSCSWANVWTKEMNSSENTLSEVTNTPSSFEEWTSLSTERMSLMVCEFWFTHWIGSVCSVSLSSTSTPPTKITMLSRMSGGASFAGNEPIFTVSRPRKPSRKSRPFVGDLYSRMPSTASGMMIEPMQMTVMPTASSRPNWRIIGTLAKRRAANANTASNVTTSSAGHRLRAVSWIGCGAVDHHLLLDARVHLDRVVDPDAEHHRQPGDGDDRERDAQVAGEAEGPHDPDEDHGEREQSPAHVEEHQEDQDHDPHGDPAEGEHAALEVVVDVLEQQRRARGDGVRVGERELRRLLRDVDGLGALLVDRLVAPQAHDHLRVLRVGQERRSALRT